MELNPIEITYGWPDCGEDEEWDGDFNVETETARVSTIIQAAETIYRLGAPWWEVKTVPQVTPYNDVVPARDITDRVHHVLLVYIIPCYADGRRRGPWSFQEKDAKLKEIRRKTTKDGD